MASVYHTTISNDLLVGFCLFLHCIFDFATSMIVRKGNLLLLRKIDQLEEVAERLHHEKWELYAIKVQENGRACWLCRD